MQNYLGKALCLAKKKKEKVLQHFGHPQNVYFMYIHMALEGIYAIRNLNNAITMALKCHWQTKNPNNCGSHSALPYPASCILVNSPHGDHFNSDLRRTLPLPLSAPFSCPLSTSPPFWWLKCSLPHPPTIFSKKKKFSYRIFSQISDPTFRTPEKSGTVDWVVQL